MLEGNRSCCVSWHPKDAGGDRLCFASERSAKCCDGLDTCRSDLHDIRMLIRVHFEYFECLHGTRVCNSSAHGIFGLGVS